jgi:hypothetical protein
MTPPILYADGSLVRGADGSRYVIAGGRRYPAPEKPGVESMNTITPEFSMDDLELYPEGNAITLEATIEAETEETEVPSDMPRRYMWSHVTLSQEEARIDGTTRTWTRQPWIGFTGGVTVFLVNAANQVIATTDLQQFGVDGFRVPFKRSDRYDTWSQSVPAPIAQQTVRLAILHHHAPRKDRWRQQLAEALQTAQDVAQVIAIVGPLIFS